MTKTFYHKAKTSRRFERLLYALVLSLVFEGIVRKLVPPLAMPVFFLKDALCLLCLSLLLRLNFKGVAARLKSLWTVFFVLLFPLLLLTAFKDVKLSFFAAKQYLLYTATGLTAVVAFSQPDTERLRRFLFFCAALLLPTAAVAVLQNSLPASHWLNLSTGGESLENFSAAGFLRVSSTFSFTAQYSWFLNAEAFLLATSFFLPPRFRSPLLRRNNRAVYAALAVLLLLSVFITGGRTAVVGCAGTLALGAVFMGIKGPGWLLSKAVPFALVCAAGIVGLRAAKPGYFAAYDQRSAGTADVSHNQEVTGRIAGSFTDWGDWYWVQDGVAVAAGNGLGIMSNGAEQISAYAASIRSTGIWLESDFPTTLWEGGLYLAFVWYGFRLAVILLCFHLWRRIKSKPLAGAASILLAYVFIHGLVDTLGMQPPLSIWWWLAVGLMAGLYQMEKRSRVFLLQARREATVNQAAMDRHTAPVSPLSMQS